MVKVLKTNAGFFLAFKDDVTLSDDELIKYKQNKFNKSYNDYDYEEFSKQFPKADFRLTDMLQNELPHGRIQQKYFNQISDMQDLKEDMSELEKKTNRYAWFCKYKLEQKDLPPPFNKQNTPIKRIVSFYYPEFDEQTQEVVCYNQNHDKINIANEAGHHNLNVVHIIDKVFMLPQEFKDTLSKTKYTPKDRKIIFFLSSLISDYLNKNDKLYITSHEMKHAQCYLYKCKLAEEKDYKELTPKQSYCYNENNEKAAYIQEIFTLCANYFLKEEDLSVFTDRYYWLKNKIKNLSPKQRRVVLTDVGFIANESINAWNEKASPSYMKKINGKSKLETITLADAYLKPVLNIDASDKTYLKYMKDMFTFTIYNPDKKAYETTNVLPLIKNPTQLPKAVESTITEAENIIKERQRELQKEGITKELISSLKDGSYKEPFQLSPLYFAKLQKGKYEK